MTKETTLETKINDWIGQLQKKFETWENEQRKILEAEKKEFASQMKAIQTHTQESLTEEITQLENQYNTLQQEIENLTQAQSRALNDQETEIQALETLISQQFNNLEGKANQQIVQQFEEFALSFNLLSPEHLSVKSIENEDTRAEFYDKYLNLFSVEKFFQNFVSLYKDTEGNLAQMEQELKNKEAALNTIQEQRQIYYQELGDYGVDRAVSSSVETADLSNQELERCVAEAEAWQALVQKEKTKGVTKNKIYPEVLA